MFTGAAVATVSRRPWLGWPAAFASHFLLDYIPHVDSHALFGAPGGGPTVPEAATAVADFVAAVAVILWLVHRRADRRLALGGALFGIIIDLAELAPVVGPWLEGFPGTAWLHQFHHGFQHNLTRAQWPLGVATQAVTIGLTAWVVCCWQPRMAVASETARGLPGAAGLENE